MAEIVMTIGLEEITMREAAKRGILGRCPCCGKGQLFARYLKQVDSCVSCGELFSGLRTDDVAPWVTIIVVGHIFLPLAFMIDLAQVMPLWAELAVWSGVFAALSMVLLPRAKGMMLGVLWQTRATAEPTFIN
jgi:uncharacterized protein (DUF983 family)